MIYTNTQSSFPDQVVPQEEKMSLDYGLAVARAIEGEWWQAVSVEQGILIIIIFFTEEDYMLEVNSPSKNIKMKCLLTGICLI